MVVKIMVSNLQQENKNNFLYAVSPYHGENSLKNKFFNLKLQEFASHVSVIASLHSNGKLSSQEVNKQLQKLWEDLYLEQN